MRGGRFRSARPGVLPVVAVGLVAQVATATGGFGQAAGRAGCVYANADYSHGAIFAGTRCNNGIWINLSEVEFRRLYPNGLDANAGAAAAAAGAAPAESVDPAAPPQGAEPAPAAGTGQ